MRPYRFRQIDVFTDTPMAGNPVAVFEADASLTPSEMRGIAKEMNLSETVFVSTCESPGADFSLRIFSPLAELPFAGHPVLGAAFHLASVMEPIPAKLTFMLKAGPFSVAIESTHQKIGRLWMDQQRPVVDPVDLDPCQLAESIGLKELHPRLPVQMASTGLPALMVPLADAGHLREVGPDRAKLKRALGGLNAPVVYCFAEEREEEMEDRKETSCFRARGFGPFIGIHEDPATGSAAGAFGGYAERNGLLAGTGDEECFVIRQGEEMGRPSRIHVKVKRKEGTVTGVSVGGSAVPIMVGILTIPEAIFTVKEKVVLDVPSFGDNNNFT